MVYSLDCCNWGERAWVAMLGTIDNLNGLLTTDPPQSPGGKIRLGKIDNLNGLLTLSTTALLGELITVKNNLQP